MVYYYAYMMHTKDFVVVMITCVLFVLALGLLFVFLDEVPAPEARGTDTFVPGQPYAAYGVDAYTSGELPNRDAFIQKVRDTYVPPPEPEPQPEPVYTPPAVPIYEPTPAPSSEMPPDDSVEFTY